MSNLCVGYTIAFLFLQVLASSPEPEFASAIPSLTTIAGRDAVLKCDVDNLGDHRVAWIHVDKQTLLTIHTHVITRNTRVAVSNQNNLRTWFLQIKNVQPEDSGYYMCQINTQPMKSQVGYLDVVVPPDFVNNNMTNRTVMVTENANVTLSCKATGNPNPKIKWRREDGQPFNIGKEQVSVYENEELVLTRVTRLHMAAYLCIASNGVPPPMSRRIYLDVTFPPLIWIQNQLVGAAEGTNISLECHTEAHPSSNNFWLRGNEPVIAVDQRYQTYQSRNSYKVHMKLTIRKLQIQDFGSYKCVAKNSLGETEGSITLYRLKIPTPEPQRPPSDEVPTRPPKKSPELVTTDQRVVLAEKGSRDNTHLPGRQQKFGDGRATMKAKNCGHQIYPPILLLNVEVLRIVRTLIVDWR